MSVVQCEPDDLLDSGDECASVEEIREHNSLRVYLPESSINYDTHVTESALEWSLHNFYILQLEPNQKRKQDIFISQSEIYFEEKWSVMEIESKGVRFFEFEASSPSFQSYKYASEVGSYSNIYFRVASKRHIYSLDPYKILDLLGDMGGLLDIVNAFGILITVSIVNEAFNRSLLSDAYQVQGYTEDNAEYYLSQKARECFKMMNSKSTLQRSQSIDRQSPVGQAVTQVELTASNETDALSN